MNYYSVDGYDDIFTPRSHVLVRQQQRGISSAQIAQTLLDPGDVVPSDHRPEGHQRLNYDRFYPDVSDGVWLRVVIQPATSEIISVMWLSKPAP